MAIIDKRSNNQRPTNVKRAVLMFALRQVLTTEDQASYATWNGSFYDKSGKVRELLPREVQKYAAAAKRLGWTVVDVCTNVDDNAAALKKVGFKKGQNQVTVQGPWEKGKEHIMLVYKFNIINNKLVPKYLRIY